jgi:hypothetical protein
MQCNVARASRFQNAVKQSRAVAQLRLRGVKLEGAGREPYWKTIGSRSHPASKNGPRLVYTPTSQTQSCQGKELEEAVRVKGTVLASSDRLIVRVFFVRVMIAMMIKRLDD